jgi:hypothetical protein
VLGEQSWSGDKEHISPAALPGVGRVRLQLCGEDEQWMQDNIVSHDNHHVLFSRVGSVRCSALSARQDMALVSLLLRCPVLCSLSVLDYLSTAAAAHLASALRTPLLSLCATLTQLRVMLAAFNGPQQIIELLTALPHCTKLNVLAVGLLAPCVDTANTLSSTLLQLMRIAPLHYIHTAAALPIISSLLLDTLTAALHQSDRCCNLITVLRVSKPAFAQHDMLRLCWLLPRLPLLQELELAFADDSSLDTFTAYVMLRPVDSPLHTLRLGVDAPLNVMPLFAALRRLRLRALFMTARTFDKELIASGLPKDGWLTKAVSSDTLDCILDRNVARHRKCYELCVRLIVLRKTKAALVPIPLDIVRWIALYVWKTRNLKCWEI